MAAIECPRQPRSSASRRTAFAASCIGRAPPTGNQGLKRPDAWRRRLIATRRCFELSRARGRGADVLVLRCDLAFRQRRPSGPPSPSGAAADRESLKVAAAMARGLAPGALFIGGQSYGGRQASMLAAEAAAARGGPPAAFLSPPSARQADAIADGAFRQAAHAERLRPWDRRPLRLARRTGCGGRADLRSRCAGAFDRGLLGTTSSAGASISAR